MSASSVAPYLALIKPSTNRFEGQDSVSGHVGTDTVGHEHDGLRYSPSADSSDMYEPFAEALRS